MKPRLPFHGVTIAVVLAATLVSLAGYSAWEELRQLRQSVTAIQASARPAKGSSASRLDADRPPPDRAEREFQRAIDRLQRFVAGSVLLVGVLGLALAWQVHRARATRPQAQGSLGRGLLERQEKLASLGTLAAGVAHEIRNPLTAINVRLHGLQRTLSPGTSEHEDVMVIDQEIRRLDRIVRDFLDFARPSEPRLVTLPVEALFRRTQRLLEPQWTRATIRLHLEPLPDVWVRVDPQQMDQVLINLVQNGAESIEGAGTVTLRARLDSGLSRVLPGNRGVVALDVIDTGRGMPPAVRKRLFDPFFTTKDGGTGLGLAVAAGIVERHGGMLQFQTHEGRGSTFSILLPLVERPTTPD